MNPFIKFISIFLTSAVLLTSCGTVSVTKRQHTKGYHVDYNNIKQNKSISASEDLASIETTQSTKKETESSSPSGKEIKSQPVDLTEKNTKTEKTTEVEENETKKRKPKQTTQQPTEKTQKNYAADNLKDLSDTFLNPLKKTTNKIKESVTNSKVVKSSTRAEGGLSLFWIVILIILILWLLGVLGEVLGNLIHLLLVIALVLLILWLLRVI
jgi:Flp pilus assembly protein TadB